VTQGAAIAELVRTDVDLASPCVSVVVSTRNHAGLLGDTVAGIEAQRDVELELIVVDNASTDGTEALMRAIVARASIPITYVRLERDVGPAEGRNAGVSIATGAFVAFTDSDCIPMPTWLANAIAQFATPAVGIVQGLTSGAEASPPLFSHWIETPELDGSFSTSNVVYRREALGEHRFDPSCDYWEDTDLGWRVRTDGWDIAFAPDATVLHQAVEVGALRWVLWPRRYTCWPAKAKRYGGFRRHLFLGVWVCPIEAAFQLAVVGLLLSRRWRGAAALVLPYVVLFARTRGLAGRAPAVKALLHVCRDAVATVTLALASARHRSVVL
jgi:GT2 family glycosyltransferase